MRKSKFAEEKIIAVLTEQEPVTLDRSSAYDYPGKMAMLSTVRK